MRNDIKEQLFFDLKIQNEIINNQSELILKLYSEKEKLKLIIKKMKKISLQLLFDFRCSEEGLIWETSTACEGMSKDLHSRCNNMMIEINKTCSNKNIEM